MDLSQIPAGFEPWTRGGSPVTAPWEPIYTRERDAGVEVGTFIRPALCNSRGLLHGGVIAALCDVAMGYTLGSVLRARGVDVLSLLTTHLSVDYIGKAERGWLNIAPNIIQAGRSSGIVEATATVDDQVIAHAKASFRCVAAKE
jgi:acyl-coenzyme A thioesterase PaaI-like protein